MAEQIPQGKIPSAPERQWVRWVEGISAWEVLRIEADAKPEEIANAFRRMSKEHHPDTGGDAAHFALIASAYAHMSKGEAFRMPEDRSDWHLRVRPDAPGSRQRGSLTLCGATFPPRSELAREDADNSDWPKCKECVKIDEIGMTYKRRTEP